MEEKEIEEKEQELNKREEELKAREEAINLKEAEFKDKETDTASVVNSVREEYDKKFNKQQEVYESKLAERNAVIKQLLNEEGKEQPKNSIVDKINKRRQAQKLF